MSKEDDAEVFRLAVRHWSDGNFEGVLSLIADGIVHIVNVDALGIPWVSSAEGKTAVTARLMLIAATFVVDAFIVESVVYEQDEIRATVLGYHTHRKTRERLDVKVRFRVRVRDGLIVRLDEFLDAAYIDAFERFVRYLEQTAQEMGGRRKPAPAGAAMLVVAVSGAGIQVNVAVGIGVGPAAARLEFLATHPGVVDLRAALLSIPLAAVLAAFSRS